jgi:hypothetical protein
MDRAFDELYELHAYLQDRYSFVGVMDFSTPSKLMSFIMDHIVTSEYHETSEEEDKDTAHPPFEEYDIEAPPPPPTSMETNGEKTGDEESKIVTTVSDTEHQSATPSNIHDVLILSCNA